MERSGEPKSIQDPKPAHWLARMGDAFNRGFDFVIHANPSDVVDELPYEKKLKQKRELAGTTMFYPGREGYTTMTEVPGATPEMPGKVAALVAQTATAAYLESLAPEPTANLE